MFAAGNVSNVSTEAPGEYQTYSHQLYQPLPNQNQNQGYYTSAPPVQYNNVPQRVPQQSQPPLLSSNSYQPQSNQIRNLQPNAVPSTSSISTMNSPIPLINPNPRVGTSSISNCEPSSTNTPAGDVDSRTLFHAYLFDYLQKSNFHQAAYALLQETDIPVVSSPSQGLPGKGKGRASDEERRSTNSPPNNLSPHLHERPQSSGGVTDSVGSSAGSTTSHFGFPNSKRESDSPASNSPVYGPDSLPRASVMVESPQGFLLEWWLIFWDQFRARAGRGGNVSARVFAEASKQSVENALIAERSIPGRPPTFNDDNPTLPPHPRRSPLPGQPREFPPPHPALALTIPPQQSQQFRSGSAPHNQSQLREIQLAQAQHAAASVQNFQNGSATYGQIPINLNPATAGPGHITQRQALMSRRGGLAPVPPPSNVNTATNLGPSNDQSHANHLLRQQHEQQIQLQQQRQQDLHYSQSIHQQQSDYHSLYANQPSQSLPPPSPSPQRDSIYQAQVAASTMRNHLHPATLEANRQHALALVEQQQMQIHGARTSSRTSQNPSPATSRGPSRAGNREVNGLPDGGQMDYVMNAGHAMHMNQPPTRRLTGPKNGNYEPPTPQPEHYQIPMNDSKHPMAAYRAQLGANQNGALSAISNQASPEQDIYSPTHGPRSLASSNSTTPLLPNGQLPSPGTLGYPGVIETKNFNNSVGTVRPPSTGPIQRIQRDKLEMLPPSGSVLPVSRRSTSNATTPQSGALTPLPIVLDSPQAPTTKRKREGNEALQKKQKQRSNTLDRSNLRPDGVTSNSLSLPSPSGSPVITIGTVSPQSNTPPLVSLDQKSQIPEPVQLSNKELEDMFALVGGDPSNPAPTAADNLFFDLDLYCDFNADNLTGFNSNTLQ